MENKKLSYTMRALSVWNLVQLMASIMLIALCIFSAITLNIIFVLLVITYFETPKIEEKERLKREKREFYYGVVIKVLKEYLEKENNNE